jgi:FlaG/FlaF family flagellin (archaellin)
MAWNRRGVSTIIATILTISLAVVGSAVYYAAVTGYMRPQAGLSPEVTISVGASGFTVVSAQAVNTGGIPFTSLTIDVSGGSSALQIVYSPQNVISAGGGTATITVQGVSGGPYAAVSSNTMVSGNLVATMGDSYSVVVEGTMTNGATYSQASSVTAQP